MGTRRWVIPLSFTKPPLTANQRFGHWAQRAKLVKQVRHEACMRARSHKFPAMGKCAVSLHYRPRDSRRRDADNLVPTLKALCDGLVDAGLVVDDTPEFMTKAMPVIHPAKKGTPASMWLEIDQEGNTK